MLIRFKKDNKCVIYNTENIRELKVDCDEVAGKEIVTIILTGDDGEHDYCHFSSLEQAREALDKIYNAYAAGLKAITVEVD